MHVVVIAAPWNRSQSAWAVIRVGYCVPVHFSPVACKREYFGTRPGATWMFLLRESQTEREGH